MKRSELTVTMSMTTFDELMDYKDRYMKLKDKLSSTLKRHKLDYDFEVNMALSIIKDVCHIPEDVNVIKLI